jgi:transcriptional regulator
MYLPEHFKETRPEVLLELIQKNALGSLITYSDDGLDANHLPFEYDQETHSLWAHIAKENDLYQLLKHPQQSLVIFKVNDAYVSPNWYLGKAEHHRAVPTWNYAVVHVHGTASLIEDEKTLRGVLARLTRHHEADQTKPWRMSDAPQDYIQDQLSKIVAIQIKITDLIGKLKLSQNRSNADKDSVAAAFQKHGKLDLSEMMNHLKDE